MSPGPPSETGWIRSGSEVTARAPAAMARAAAAAVIVPLYDVGAMTIIAATYLTPGRLAFAMIEVFDPEHADVLCAQDVAGPDDYSAKRHDT